MRKKWILILMLFLDIVVIAWGIFAIIDIRDAFPYGNEEEGFHLAMMQAKAVIIAAEIISCSIITSIGLKCFIDAEK